MGFGGTGRKRKGPRTKQCTWRKHGSSDTRLAEACPPKLRNTLKYRVVEMHPKWPFWKHRAPKMRLVEAQCAHRKHCYPEIPLGSHPTSRVSQQNPAKSGCTHLGCTLLRPTERSVSSAMQPKPRDKGSPMKTQPKEIQEKRALTPILLKSIKIRIPFLSRYFCTKCFTIRLPFVSRYFCRRIRVRGHNDIGNTPRNGLTHRCGSQGRPTLMDDPLDTIARFYTSDSLLQRRDALMTFCSGSQGCFRFGKGVEKVSFQKNPFLEILENLEVLETLENPQTVENKRESDHCLEIVENLEILELLEIPPVKSPLS